MNIHEIINNLDKLCNISSSNEKVKNYKFKNMLIFIACIISFIIIIIFILYCTFCNPCIKKIKEKLKRKNSQKVTKKGKFIKNKKYFDYRTVQRINYTNEEVGIKIFNNKHFRCKQ